MQRQGTMDSHNNNQAQIRRPQQEMLQDHNDIDRMYYNQDQATHDSYPISIKDYLRNEIIKYNKQQTDDKLNELRQICQNMQ